MFTDRDASKLRESLDEMLEKVQSLGGSFATSGHYSEAPMPGSSIEGIGPVALPLTERDGHELSLACSRTPGSNKSSLEDSRIKGQRLAGGMPHEISTHSLNIGNPGWKLFVSNVAANVIEELGIEEENNGAFYSDLSKAYLDKPGSSFKLQQECVFGAYFVGQGPVDFLGRCHGKMQRIIESFVVCLPSKHEGGGFFATYQGNHRQLSTASGSCFRYTYIVWYKNLD